MNFNEKELFDKVYGCWIGKNIGGTLGTPFEGKQELLDITGFNSKPGNPLPNDDLDLQLVWLDALEKYGPLGVNERNLGESWISYIPPSWNEYGIGKSNMRAGLLPPLSGDHENDWKDSNGAWIRSEIWACSTPGRPDIVKKYAYYDACVDHGTAEGTYAEIFTATVESAAFVEKDPMKLIDIGLSYLPKDCRMARSIRIVTDAYQSGVDWKEARARVLADSKDLGWFQAPGNVAFTMIGWLYGEGDFKKSLLTAINCGDDTDCTGATLGSILGIIGGYEAIPKDWIQYIGDDIITKAVDRGSLANVPETCTALANRTIAMMKQIQGAYRTGITVSEEPTDLSDVKAEALYCREKPENLVLNGSIVYDFYYVTARVTYPDGVNAKAGDTVDVHVELTNNTPHQLHGNITYFLPEGVTGVSLPKHVIMQTHTMYTSPTTAFDARLNISEEAAATNRGVIQVVVDGHPGVVLIPVLIFGV